MIRDRRIRHVVADGDLVIVDFAPGLYPREPPADGAPLLQVVLRRILLEQLLQVPDHRIGIELGAVVEGYVFPQLEDPFLVVFRIGIKLLCERRHDYRNGFALVQVPIDK